MGMATHDIERGAKVAEIFDIKGKALPQIRLGIIMRVNYGWNGIDGEHINADATSGDIISIDVDFLDGGSPVHFRGTSQLALHQKADMAALERLTDKAQNRVALDGRNIPKLVDAGRIANGPKIAPNDPDMGLRRK